MAAARGVVIHPQVEKKQGYMDTANKAFSGINHPGACTLASVHTGPKQPETLTAGQLVCLYTWILYAYLGFPV